MEDTNLPERGKRRMTKDSDSAVGVKPANSLRLNLLMWLSTLVALGLVAFLVVNNTGVGKTTTNTVAAYTITSNDQALLIKLKTAIDETKRLMQEDDFTVDFIEHVGEETNSMEFAHTKGSDEITAVTVPDNKDAGSIPYLYDLPVFFELIDVVLANPSGISGVAETIGLAGDPGVRVSSGQVVTTMFFTPEGRIKYAVFEVASNKGIYREIFNHSTTSKIQGVQK